MYQQGTRSSRGVATSPFGKSLHYVTPLRKNETLVRLVEMGAVKSSLEF